jgi:hypothetical protein
VPCHACDVVCKRIESAITNIYSYHNVIDVIEVYETLTNATAQDISWAAAVHCCTGMMFRVVENLYIIARG